MAVAREHHLHSARNVPPYSPDLNPVDYAILGALQKRVYHNRKFETVDQLKQVIVLEWHRLPHHFTDNISE